MGDGSAPGLRRPGAKVFVAALASALVALLGACAGPGPGTDGGGAKGARLRVVTTFLPITLFTKAVAGDCALVEPLLPSGVGPHDFQARPADLARLQRARVLVKNGLGLETFLDKLISSANNPKLTVIDTSTSVAFDISHTILRIYETGKRNATVRKVGAISFKISICTTLWTVRTFIHHQELMSNYKSRTNV